MAAASRPIFLLFGRYFMTLAVFQAVAVIFMIGAIMIDVVAQDLGYRMRDGLTMVESMRWILENRSIGELLGYAGPSQMSTSFFLVLLLAVPAAVMTRPDLWRRPFLGIILATLPVAGILALMWAFSEELGIDHGGLIFASIVGPIAAAMGAYTVRRLYVWLER